jgi:regulatory associated protein of mTOR
MMGNGPGAPGFSTGEDPMRECILLAACGAGELLPQNPELPADVFTACLTTPIKVLSPTLCLPVCYLASVASVLQPAV